MSAGGRTASRKLLKRAAFDHGFPVRMVVPGLYGYVSACKWIEDIE
ncbi:molybdopterin-dependent oxidoreductase, partial [Streptomyces sp. 900105245]